MSSDPSVAVDPGLEARVFATDRPVPKLLAYYSLCCAPLLVFPPAAILVWTVNYFRYHTLRYRFDREGISMRWGILFRREVILNYARIQDIHLVSNVVERWLGLARVQVQTASGSSGPELTIEGLPEFEAIRDYLYLRMRGTRDPHAAPAAAPGSGPAAGTPCPVRPATLAASPAPANDAELAAVLREIAAELRALRESSTRR
jgi:putative membrane protein